MALDDKGIIEAASSPFLRNQKSTREPKPYVRTSHNPKTDMGTAPQIPKDSEKGFPLLRVRDEFHTFDDLIVQDQLKAQLIHIVNENKSFDRLSEYGIRPKQKLLFCGPPGTGKTLTARIMSTELRRPFIYVLFDSILSSYLGETATNLRKIFDFIEQGEWIVLFDEFDIIGKKRDDPQEHGEIKRVVNNLIQMIDNYEGKSVIIAATNHPHLLDTAIWRRFDEILYFDPPDKNRRKLLFRKYLSVIRKASDYSLDALADHTRGFSGAEIMQVCHDALRRSVVYSAETINRKDIMWAIGEQKRRRKIIKGSASVVKS